MSVASSALIKKTIQNHIEAQHNLEANNKCGFCVYESKDRANVVEHVKNNHDIYEETSRHHESTKKQNSPNKSDVRRPAMYS